MMGTTPGPWRINARCSTLIEADGDRSVCSTGGYFNSAEADGGHAENEANARLIAAAPDLYAACAAFVDAYERSLQLEKTDVALRAARAALAKAETPLMHDLSRARDMER